MVLFFILLFSFFWSIASSKLSQNLPISYKSSLSYLINAKFISIFVDLKLTILKFNTELIVEVVLNLTFS